MKVYSTPGEQPLRGRCSWKGAGLLLQSYISVIETENATHHGPNSYFVKFSNMFGECARRERMQVLPGQKLAAPLVLLREILLLSSVESKKGARHPAVEESRPACRVKEDGRIRIIDGYDQKNNRVWKKLWIKMVRSLGLKEHHEREYDGVFGVVFDTYLKEIILRSALRRKRHGRN
jgi:hypothetical protein